MTLTHPNIAMRRFLLTALLLALLAVASAQELRPRAKTFRIYDATAETDKTGRAIALVDTDNGVDKGYVLDDLTGYDGQVRIYVTYKPWADRIMRDYRTGENKGKVQSFFLFYDNRAALCLRPSQGHTYSTAGAYEIAERLKGQFYGDMLEYLGGDPADIYELSLIVVKDPMRQEQFDVEWIENYEPNNLTPDCPLYYTGKLKIGNVFMGFVRRSDLEQSTIQLGNELLFSERFDIKGPSDKRVVVDRRVEVCDFNEDFNLIGRRFMDSPRALRHVDRLLAHTEGTYHEVFREPPYVFPGKKFQQMLWRRTMGHTERDTMDHYRRQTQYDFAFSKLEGLYKEVATDSVDTRIDCNLLARYLSKYPTFWALSDEIASQLPRDGGEEYPDTADVRKYHHLRLSTQAYLLLHSYIEEGKQKKGQYNKIVEGYVPQIYAVRSQAPRYMEYWLANDLYSQTQQLPAYRKMEQDGGLRFVRSEQGGVRVRFDRDQRDRFVSVFRGLVLSHDSLFLSEEPLRDTLQLHWHMPDPDLYYKLRHVYYLHDFTAADTTSSECSCARMNPMRFVAISTEPAMPDCPPYLNGSDWLREDYRPRSKTDEPQSVEHEAHIAFLRGQAAILDTLADNAYQLDSLRAAADAIMGRDVEFAPGGINRIDTIAIVGISSPEGRFERNLDLAHQRSEAVVQWVRSHCQIHTAAEVYVDSVATWYDVAEMIELYDAEHRDLADRIRERLVGRDPREVTPDEVGYSPQDSVFEAAMERLRRVQIRFVYTALHEPDEDTIIDFYLNGKGADAYGAFYYYVLLKSDKISYEEKLQICDELLQQPRRRGDTFTLTRDVNRASTEQWYDLLRPIAANYIAADMILRRQYDPSVLAPFIDVNQKGNQASHSLGTLVEGVTPKVYKYVNADFVLYNQIQMLIGVGTNQTLQQADSLIQLLSVTTYSPEFEEKYKPSRLPDLLECYNYQSFLHDRSLANRIASTNIVNYYVIQHALAHDQYQKSGRYNDPVVTECFTAAFDSLSALERRLDEDRPERHYFRAVSFARYGDMLSDENKPALMDSAVQALVDLFSLDDNYISICQGDIYVRDIFRNPAQKKLHMDIYLEAVEAYIKKITAEDDAAE